MNNQTDWHKIIGANKQEIVDFAMTFRGRPYSYREFNCGHFIRAVYGKFGIPIIPGAPIEPIADFGSPEAIGYLVLLRHRADKREINYTHMAIYIGDQRVIHNTRYMGGKVVVSSLQEVLRLYDIVEYPEFSPKTETS